MKYAIFILVFLILFGCEQTTVVEQSEQAFLNLITKNIEFTVTVYANDKFVCRQYNYENHVYRIPVKGVFRVIDCYGDYTYEYETFVGDTIIMIYDN